MLRGDKQQKKTHGKIGLYKVFNITTVCTQTVAVSELIRDRFLTPFFAVVVAVN